jgi:hypothetical protein
MMAKNLPNKRATPSFDARFAFIGDAVAPATSARSNPPCTRSRIS